MQHLLSNTSLAHNSDICCIPHHSWCACSLLVSKHSHRRGQACNKGYPIYLLEILEWAYILGVAPLLVTVTTRIIRITTCLVANPQKPSFPPATGRGPHPTWANWNSMKHQAQHLSNKTFLKDKSSGLVPWIRHHRPRSLGSTAPSLKVTPPQVGSNKLPLYLGFIWEPWMNPWKKQGHTPKSWLKSMKKQWTATWKHPLKQRNIHQNRWKNIQNRPSSKARNPRHWHVL